MCVAVIGFTVLVLQNCLISTLFSMDISNIISLVSNLSHALLPESLRMFSLAFRRTKKNSITLRAHNV